MSRLRIRRALYTSRSIRAGGQTRSTKSRTRPRPWHRVTIRGCEREPWRLRSSSPEQVHEPEAQEREVGDEHEGEEHENREGQAGAVEIEHGFTEAEG